MRKLSLLFILLISIGVFGQPPTRFYGRYGGTGEDIGYSGKPTLDKQYIIAGSSSSYGTHGSTDVYLTKIDSMGFPMWEHFYGGQGNEVGKSVIQLPDSGYAIAGFTDSYGAGGFDAFIIRVDKDGVFLWQRTFGGTDWDFASDLVQAIDGGIFVVGNTYSFGNGKKDGFVIKYDMAGNLLTQKFIGGAEDDELRSIIVTNDLNLATVGYTESRGEINGDGYFAKLDLNGDTLFTRTFGGAGKDYATDLVQKVASEGYDYVICGARTYLFPTKTNSYIYRISPSGNFVSELDNYNSSGDETWESIANSVVIPYLTGFLRTIPVSGVSEQGNIMVKYPNGYDHSINSFGGYEDEYCNSIEGTGDGGYVITGSTSSYESIGKDIYLIKIDSSVVITYSSVVGLTESFKEDQVLMSYKDNDVVTIYFPESKIPEKGIVCGVNGVIYRRFEDIGKNLEIDLSTLDAGLYIIQFELLNGQLYTRKLIRR
jgi:hypothetical protein